MKVKLSIIIVNYNVKYFLEQALLSVRKAVKDLPAEIFVVDNNSVDDSIKMVAEKFPEVKRIENQENVGFSKANNQAIHLSTGTYILLLNPDTVVEEDTFIKTVEFMDQHPNAGGLGIKMIDGSGKFLPESKRGFPSPFVAFCKTFGLASLFPKSRLFNHYHMGYLNPAQNHQVEVLAGAFMLLRKSVLDEIGLLDEAFFMYGEDIDLSYRIIQAGYDNYYFADSQIIHYKGESTKRGSLNYVRVFYQAMIIFARKHFSGTQANLFVWMLQFAIYFRAGLTLIRQLSGRLVHPVLDGSIMVLGLLVLKQFWASYHFNDPNYYDQSFTWFNIPLYTGIWLLTLAMIGAYEEKYHLRRIFFGILLGTVLIAAVYGFLDMAYRSSRAIILLATFWNLLFITISRYISHFVRFRNLSLGKNVPQRLIIVGSANEAKRVKSLLQEAQIQKEIIGRVSPEKTIEPKALNTINRLDEVTQIYKVEEIIFCSKNISTQDIMHWMATLGPNISYKILPEESLSIIGSQSKKTRGELYTIDIQYAIDQPINRRQKRLLDLALALLLIITFPIHLLFLKARQAFFQNVWKVITGQHSWVGYRQVAPENQSLPKIKPGILTPLDEFDININNPDTIRRLNFLYAKNFTLSADIDIIWKGYQYLGRRSTL